MLTETDVNETIKSIKAMAYDLIDDAELAPVIEKIEKLRDLALRAVGGDALAWCRSSEWNDAKVKRQSFNGWRQKYDDCDMALYTAPAAPANEALAKQIRELGASIPCATGGTFENDPPDAIIDAATRLIKGVAAAALGGKS